MVIMLFVMLGEALRYILPWPIPASIYGLVLLFVALATKVVKLKWVEDTANFLLSIIIIMFVVLAVGIMDLFDVLAGNLPVILAIIIITYFATFAATGLLADWLIKRRDKK